MAEATTPLRLLVCGTHRFGPTAHSCGQRGGDVVLATLREAATEGRLGSVEVRRGPCLGHCTIGPNARVVGGPMLHGLSRDCVEAVAEAIRHHRTRADA